VITNHIDYPLLGRGVSPAPTDNLSSKREHAIEMASIHRVVRGARNQNRVLAQDSTTK
jgi:hypothetical protein